MIGVVLLGATGSIGQSTLDVIDQHPNQFKLIAAVANQQLPRMLEICQKYQPKYAVMVQSHAAEQLKAFLAEQQIATEVLGGCDHWSEIMQDDDVHTVVAGISGAAGLVPTYAAVCAGKRVLLANKESLVMMGDLFIKEANKYGAEIIPIDSEHQGVFQCVPDECRLGRNSQQIKRVILTASGGPFLNTPYSDLHHVTVEQACKHPTWSMGHKISVDSATMINKGFEVMEACILFGLSVNQLEVVIHPQSIIHSLVEYWDGSMLAQMAANDMRIPIGTALAWPNRLDKAFHSLSLTKLGKLEFLPLDPERYPGFTLALAAFNAGGTMPVAFNAANEIAVHSFLTRKIPFLSIIDVIEEILASHENQPVTSLQQVLTVDEEVRIEAQDVIQKMSDAAVA